MKIALTTMIIVATTFLQGRDAISTGFGEMTVVKISEVNNHLGRLGENSIALSDEKTETRCHAYRNEIQESEIGDTLLFEKITKRNNKVFIYSENTNAIIHATNAIEKWGYWRVTKNKVEADFILKFNVRFAGLGDAWGSAQFIAPENNKILKTTKEVNTMTGWDFNTKRGVINKIVRKEIKPMFIIPVK
jgi:hypothetical protein